MAWSAARALAARKRPRQYCEPRPSSRATAADGRTSCAGPCAAGFVRPHGPQLPGAPRDRSGVRRPVGTHVPRWPSCARVPRSVSSGCEAASDARSPGHAPGRDRRRRLDVLTPCRRRQLFRQHLARGGTGGPAGHNSADRFLPFGHGWLLRDDRHAAHPRPDDRSGRRRSKGARRRRQPGAGECVFRKRGSNWPARDARSSAQSCLVDHRGCRAEYPGPGARRTHSDAPAVPADVGRTQRRYPGCARPCCHGICRAHRHAAACTVAIGAKRHPRHRFKPCPGASTDSSGRARSCVGTDGVRDGAARHRGRCRVASGRDRYLRGDVLYRQSTNGRDRRTFGPGCSAGQRRRDDRPARRNRRARRDRGRPGRGVGRQPTHRIACSTESVPATRQFFQ